MLKQATLLLFTLGMVSCNTTQNEKTESTPQLSTKKYLNVEYAKGFTIEEKEGHKLLTVKNPWPGAEKDYKYALIEANATLENTAGFDGVVQLPLQSMVVTSTTHIPSLEMLGALDKLTGFPNTRYVSSPAARKLIAANRIKELGKNESINTEVLMDLSPGAVVTFAVTGENKTVQTIKKTGTPVLYNADWTETSPLGKAEWIKFFGALLNKEKEADSIFDTIKTAYETAKTLAAGQATGRPTVLSGAMYRDVWYLPQGDSWAAQFITDAQGEYLWKNSKGTGSISLNVESVLEKAQQAEFWIGPGQFTSKNQMAGAHQLYTQFDAFNNGRVYNFTAKKGETGGVLYYELAPNRPDLVLKDIIKILHPGLLPQHDLYFFSILE
ncbi:MAG: ABC transporter substrate-binding protein [Marinirhabdus sp.]